MKRWNPCTAHPKPQTLGRDLSILCWRCGISDLERHVQQSLNVRDPASPQSLRHAVRARSQHPEHSKSCLCMPCGLHAAGGQQHQNALLSDGQHPGWSTTLRCSLEDGKLPLATTGANKELPGLSGA